MISKPGATKSKPDATKTKLISFRNLSLFNGFRHYLASFAIRLFCRPVDPRVQAPLLMSIARLLFFVNRLKTIDFQNAGASASASFFRGRPE
jgi:hypothetical protein